MQLHHFSSQTVSRSETANLISILGNIPLERIGVGEDFADSDLKKKAPFGQIPVLFTDDGTILGQSVAICQLLAEKANLLPSQSNLNQGQDLAVLNAIALSYVLGVDELRSEAYRAHRISTSESAEKDKTEWKEGRQAFFLGRFELVLSQSKSGFLVGNSVSWADISLYDVLTEQEFLFDFEKYPNLKHLKNTVEELPKLKSANLNDSRFPKNYLPKWK